MSALYDASTRLLTILHLLHIHESLSAEVLAAKIEVSPRTVRRYITRLRDIGVSVEASMGANGGYALTTRKQVPPSIFSKGELRTLLFALLKADLSGFEHQAVQALSQKISQLLEDS